MPIPFIIGAAAAIAGAAGVGAGVYGAKKMHDAKKCMEEAEERNKENTERYEKQNKATISAMDRLGKRELQILESFNRFSDAIAKIQNLPEFADIEIGDCRLPRFTPDEVRDVSVGAAVLLGGLGGSAAGVAGGFAASGATFAAVTALASASTGTAISTLSGAAATNAVLAFLGGGSLAAGGGGVALGTAVLSGATLGVGLIVGGCIFAAVGNKTMAKAEEALDEVRRAERAVDKICDYLSELKRCADQYRTTLEKLHALYLKHVFILEDIVSRKNDYNLFTSEEKQTTYVNVQLVSVLYNMCKVKLVIQHNEEDGVNEINHVEIDASLAQGKAVLGQVH